MLLDVSFCPAQPPDVGRVIRVFTVIVLGRPCDVVRVCTANSGETFHSWCPQLSLVQRFFSHYYCPVGALDAMLYQKPRPCNQKGWLDWRKFHRKTMLFRQVYIQDNIPGPFISVWRGVNAQRIGRCQQYFFFCIAPFPSWVIVVYTTV